jgi:hypothetical protein
MQAPQRAALPIQALQAEFTIHNSSFTIQFTSGLKIGCLSFLSLR